MAACNAYSEVVTLNQSMHRSFSPPLTGLLNFPIIEHFKGGEIWGHGSDGEGLDDQADLRNLENLLVRVMNVVAGSINFHFFLCALS